ncbi:hypothetical protein A2576_00260 [Candidatus Amesbacteria bacterium RIFOXYD1_FULL_47_9]|uniref:Uncharacterized protein n=1 Tax=Candidatus Amesbacteria bacterium RIFOXYD1_FULL_47_9 TaxID=1797267 RepID=A0A1F5A2B2_9BACT|nr:MAG: hypothetical protein A2354_01430 [Candidatus Amesbacteria bacterium RIFOXYB1_FULL_47_12]OGD12478.1 MAG: hypothetical protein A2576_00260 [Candidatus Amesbacteria bacterium RIFOXYD1_FULL_47_9]
MQAVGLYGVVFGGLLGGGVTDSYESAGCDPDTDGDTEASGYGNTDGYAWVQVWQPDTYGEGQFDPDEDSRSG